MASLRNPSFLSTMVGAAAYSLLEDRITLACKSSSISFQSQTLLWCSKARMPVLIGLPFLRYSLYCTKLVRVAVFSFLNMMSRYFSNISSLIRSRFLGFPFVVVH